MLVAIGTLRNDPGGEPDRAICDECLDWLIFAEDPDAEGPPPDPKRPDKP